MLRLAVDEDFDNRIVRGLLRLLPELDIVRVQDAGLMGRSESGDPRVGGNRAPDPAHARRIDDDLARLHSR